MNMKNRLKKNAKYLFLPFAISFLLFIHEPIVMYASNIDDFWFGFRVLIEHSLLLFVACFASLAIVFFVLNFFKLKKLLNNVVLLLFCGFLVFYVHSNWLAGFLPSLDGSLPNWNGVAANISSILATITIIVAVFVTTKMIGIDKMMKVSFYASLVIVIMLSASLFSIIASKSVMTAKSDSIMVTSKGINRLSNDENFLIFMVDMVDSSLFQTIVENNDEYKDSLKDFSYFPDTMSGYSCTRESIPFIFSGNWFEGGDFNEYSTNSFSNSLILNRVRDNGFERYFYEEGLIWNSSTAAEFNNLVSGIPEVKSRVFVKQEIKYVLFKTLPFPLKRFSRIESMDFNASAAPIDTTDPLFSYRDIIYKDNYLPLGSEMTSNKLFQFLHIEGGHMPFDMDENANLVDTVSSEDISGYKRKLEATAYLISKYINRLKESGAYDNSTIVIMADHGHVIPETPEGRFNPILYIKGKGEHHHALKISEKQVHQQDLDYAFVELADGKKSTEIFSDVPNEGRERRGLGYFCVKEYSFREFVQKKKAWDVLDYEPTGKSFDFEH